MNDVPYVYDIEVEDNHNYFINIGDDVCVHNSSKTYSLIQFFIVYAIINWQRANRVVVARKKSTWLSATVWSDFKKILLEYGLLPVCRINNTLKVIQLYSTTFEFVGLDDAQRLHGLTTDIFWINEAMEASKDDFDQLEQRCSRFSVLDYNPSAEEHWIYDNVCPREDCYFDHSTMLDNPFIPENMKRKILSYEPTEENFKQGTADRRKWMIYGLGKRAKIEGLVFDDYTVIKEIPEWVKSRFRGMDFGYTCFRGDTLVATLRGDIPIKDVVAGDMVLTRKGYRQVRRNIYNGVRKVVEKKLVTGLHNSTIFATFEHNFNANGTWKKYGELTSGDSLFVLSPLMEKNTRDTRMGNIPITIIANGRKMESIIRSSCIMQYMSPFMMKFPMVKLFITTTITHLITTLAILLRSLHRNIPKSMTMLQNGQKIIQKRCKSENSLRTTGNSGGKKLKNLLQIMCEYVKGVEQNTHRLIHINDFAQNHVTIDGSIKHTKMTLNLPANGVVKHLWGTNTSSQKRVAPNVHISSQELLEVETKSEQWCDVYDLEIEDIHEYFANGFLVHNCDPTAFAMVAFRSNGIYIDEECYRTNMLSTDIIRELKRVPKLKIWSESADPRLIDEIYNAGFNINPVKKYPGSIEAGIDYMKTKKIYITERSLNAKKEFDNYTYQQDKNGKWLNVPVDDYNHIIDGVRYVCLMEKVGRVVSRRNVKKSDLGIF